ncbi:hypothetical protein KBI23_09265 [bacterium]|nr:hypothetical protein [bacterium]MBP9810560.1 hypothetical protein [bacterium]
MISSFFDTALPAVIAALFLILCVGLGSVTAGAVENGPTSLVIYGMVVGLVMAVVASFLVSISTDSDSMVGTIVAAVVVFAATVYYPADTLINGHQYAANVRVMAPVVRKIGLERFGDIESHGNGLIVEADLDKAVSGLTLTGEELSALSHMRSNLSDVGHVIDSHTSTTYVWISTGNGGGYMSPIISTTYTYGINRADLESYPQRMIEKWKNW